MGWFDNGSTLSLTSNGQVRRRSPPRRSTSVYSGYHSRHSAPSIFSMGGGSRTSSHGRSSSNRRYGSSSHGHGYGRSSPSVFSTFSSSSSSRRARPRAGFVHRVIRYIKNVLHDIFHYARRHPFKVFFMVIVPLLSSGVLQKLLGMIGVHLPRKLFGGGGGSGGFGGGDDNGVKDHVMSLMKIAKMFV